MGEDITSNTYSTGYEDIDKINNKQNDLYNKAYEQQQNIVNTQTQQAIDEVNRNKDKLNQDVTKQNKALYTDYTKQVNPYGATAESLATNGLTNSGVAESTKKNLYNNYQNNRTETLNNAKNILTEYDAQITEARNSGNIQLAQFALESYKQQMDNLYKNYQLIQNQKQFDYQKDRDQINDKKWQDEFSYQKDRDQITDGQWNKQFDYNANRDQIGDNQWQQQFDFNKYADDRNYNYQVGRDQVADGQWQQEYNLSKKKASLKSGSNGLMITDRNNSNNVEKAKTIIQAGDSILKRFANSQVSDQMIASALETQVANGTITKQEALNIINSVR